MSNLFKSKILLGVFAIALAFAVAGSAMAADGAVTKTLRQGMRDTQVKYLQQMLNESGYTVAASGRAGSMGMETTYFGPATSAAVKAFQAAKNLVADGIFGPASRSAFVGGGSVSGQFPAGCQSAAGYSPTTGAKCDSLGSTGTPVSTGPVMVALAADTPASGSVIAPSSGAVFAKYVFTGNGTVTSLKLMRTGISSNTAISNIFLYDGATRLTDGASLGSDNTATFNAVGGLFTVAGTKVISVVADMASTTDYSVGLNLISVTSGGTTTQVNIVGNVQYIATATTASVALSSALGSGNTDAGTDITVWQGTVTIGTRDVILKSLALRQVGSIVSGDIRNFKLYADGVLVTTVAGLDSNGYVTFPTATVLKTGARILKVTADVIGGAGRTVQFSLRGAYDIQATDTQYNANSTATGTFPFGPSAFTVNSGTLTVLKKADSQSANVTLGASDQSFATYTFTAYGEPIKVETLRVGMITTGGTVTEHTLRNVRILVNGGQVGSTTDVPAAASFAAASGTSFTTNFIVYPGTPATVEIHADVYDSEGTDNIAAGTVTAVQALLVGGTATSNGVPQTSLGTINVPSATNVLGNVLTISSGSIAVAKTSSYADQLTAVPATAYKIGSYQLTGNSTEAVNLNTLYVGFTADSTVTEATDLSDLYVVYGGTMSPVKGTVSSTILNGNSWSINKTLAKNETMQIDVYATLASTVSTNAVITTLAVAGTTASSGIAVYADSVADTVLDAGLTGQTITGATGSVTMSQDASTAVAQLVDDSGTIKSLTAKIAAVTDSYVVTDMVVTVTNASAVSTVTLKDHDTGEVIGAAKPGATSLTWSGLSYAVNAGQTKKIAVELALTSVGVGAGTSDAALTTAITGFTARNSAGTSAAGTGSATGNAIYIYKAVPLISSVALPTSTLTADTMVLAKFTVSSNGTGTIAWKQAMFEVSKSGWPVLATPTLWNSDTGTQITAAVVFQNGSTTAAACDATNVTCEILVTVGANSDDNVVEQVSGARTYEIRSAITGTLATGYVNTKLDRNTAAHAVKGVFTANRNDGTANSTSFTWSDESASATSDTGESTWLPDFLIKTLPTTWSLTRS